MSMSRSLPLFIMFVLQVSTLAHALELKREVFVEDEEITLADLVSPGSVSAEIQATLKTISLGASPTEENEVVLLAPQVSEAIRQAARAQAGANAAAIMDRAGLKIPSEIHVRKASVAFNETHFREQLTEAIKLDCSDCRIEINRVRMPPAPVGSDGLAWRINTQNQRIRGNFSVRVDYRKGTQITASEYVSGEVRLFKTVAVLNKSVNLGERIQAEDFSFKSLDTTFWNDSPLAQNELAGAKLKRALRAQDPIQRADIERERLIQKGEMVEVHIVQPGLDVGMNVIAQDAGQMGDVIRVLNPDTKKQLNGIVIAKGIVELKMKINRIFLFILLCVLSSGCSTLGQKWKDLVGGDPAPAPVTKNAAPTSDDLKYSDQQDVPVQENKHYRRMTREQFEKEGLGDETGSLWSGDGQQPYLFSANMVRIPGDSVNITLDGEPKKQLTQKANVLAQLLKKASRQAASVPPAQPGADGKTDGAVAKADAAANPATGADKKDDKKEEEDAKDNFTVSSVPSRIVERIPDGSYRVRGTQTFMIGKDEYRVIATGLVKSSDITDEGVASSKMMDPKFDIVSMRSSREKQ